MTVFRASQIGFRAGRKGEFIGYQALDEPEWPAGGRDGLCLGRLQGQAHPHGGEDLRWRILLTMTVR
jgi:hypothetical protein